MNFCRVVLPIGLSGTIHNLGRRILHIGLVALMLLPAFVQTTKAQGPEEVHFRQDISTPSGTALRDSVDLWLRSLLTLRWLKGSDLEVMRMGTIETR